MGYIIFSFSLSEEPVFCGRAFTTLLTSFIAAEYLASAFESSHSYFDDEQAHSLKSSRFRLNLKMQNVNSRPNDEQKLDVPFTFRCDIKKGFLREVRDEQFSRACDYFE